ncbi:MAG: hypothetical protein IPM47_17705 [Sphingobacteriales bacterium]|nr:MAG: hypothetical protein IPM47_17705 [Sphingobacteriales bacterium]
MKKQNRRKFILYSLGILGSGVLTAWFFRRQLVRKFLFTFPDNLSVTVSSAPSENEVCVLTAKQIEGPFYFPSPERSNIVEDRKGALLKLKMQVINYPDCTPIRNAIVDVWQADAEGNYSGYPEQISQDEWKTFMLFGKHGEKRENGEYTVKPITDSRYLRGIQRTDENGWVTFNTIIPCWYIGRVPHIHFKVFLNDKEQIISQLFFDKDFCDNLFTTVEPYNKMGKCPIDFKNDGTLAMVNGEQSGLLLSVQNDGNSNYISTCRIGIKSSQ